MTATTPKPTRADVVRRRRAHETKQRRQSAARAATTARNGPLVSRPRRVTGRPGESGRNRRRFEIALPSGASLHVPAMPRIQVSWRLASFSIVLLLAGMLARLLTDPRLYIDGINLGGASFVPGEEIYAESGVARQHIFWVDPALVQKKVEAIPGIASASVAAAWPNVVTIVVTERVPLVTWVEGEHKWWVDAQGHRFKAREEIASLLPITVDDAASELPDANRLVPVEAIQGALQLKELRPNIELLHYDDQHGLSYQDGRGWRGYFGVGTDMAQKLAVYETLVDNLLSRGIHPATISVENGHAPYYRR